MVPKFVMIGQSGPRYSHPERREGRVFVDADLLRMGADFSDSAGAIVQRGAAKLASAQPAAGLFGDFPAAHGFHCALSRAQEGHVAMLHGHRATLATLAEKATSAAAIFVKHDAMSGSALDSAAQALS